ncbi:MAG: hypothetical protein ISS55_09930 [Dehalococcoidales bacterium]|nr:hypothetical protein [Dehalococcoidales bacterium]
MDIEDINELFDADRLARKLGLKLAQHLDRELSPLMRQQQPKLSMPIEEITSNIYVLNANLAIFSAVIAEFVAQNNQTLWKTAEQHFALKEDNQ